MQTEAAAVSPEQVSPSERREALQKILASPLFRRSFRLRRFLDYVVEKSVEDDGSSLTEQQIGVALFERRPSYDTSADNIVRVNATELRKRLELFYAGEGADESIVIDIPRGSYRPVFLRRSPPENPADPASVEHAPAPEVTPVHHPVIETPHVATEAPERRRSLSSYAIPILSLLLLLSVATAIYQSVRVAGLERQLRPWQSQAALRSFWQNFFEGHDHTTIVLADTSFAMAQDLSGYRLTLDDYLRLRYPRLSDLGSGKEGKSADAVFALLSNRNSGSIGDFLTAQRIMDLRPGVGDLRIQFARDFSGEALRHDSSILIGSTRSNPWVEPFQDKLFYRMKPSPDGQGILVQLSNPQTGEQSVYATSSDPNRTDGFCVIAFVPNLSGDGKTLIIAGTDSQATEAGGDFLTQEHSMESLLAKMQTTSFSSFQLLLRTSRIAGSPLRTEIVSFRLGEVT